MITDLTDLTHPLPEEPEEFAGEDEATGWRAMADEVVGDREEYEQRLRLTWEHEDDYDPLLSEIALARYAMLQAEARMRLLIAYGREFTRPRPYRLEDLAGAAGMSISGIRTAYDEDEIAEVAKRTGTRPRRPAEVPVTGESAPGCACRPPWPALVVHNGDGDVAVMPSAMPGGLVMIIVTRVGGIPAGNTSRAANPETGERDGHTRGPEPAEERPRRA